MVKSLGLLLGFLFDIIEEKVNSLIKRTWKYVADLRLFRLDYAVATWSLPRFRNKVRGL